MVQHAQALLQQSEFIRLTALQVPQSRDTALSALSVDSLHSEALFWLEEAVGEGEMLLSQRTSGPHNISIIEAMTVLGSLYHGGTAVARNISKAEDLYRKAFRISLKHQFPRTVAPFMGLLALQIDRNLCLLVGPDFTYRLITWIRSRVILPTVIDDTANPAERHIKAWLSNREDLLLLILCGALCFIIGIKNLKEKQR